MMTFIGFALLISACGLLGGGCALKTMHAHVRTYEDFNLGPKGQVQSGCAESFNGWFRRECLNRELIYTLSEGRVVFEGRRRYYNTERPHESLGLQTPAAFAKKEREHGSGSSRATPASHRNLEWKQNNKPKPPKIISS